MVAAFYPAPSIAGGTAYFSIELKDWDAPGDRTHSIALFGWCVSTTGSPIAIEFYLHGTLIATAPLTVPRPDVVKALLTAETPLLCGFHLRISKLVLPPGAEIEIRLWESRGRPATARLTLGTIGGLPSAPVASRYHEQCHPLLLLGMGRSGTTFLMGLLGAHPEILVPGPHPYEMRQPVWLWQAAHVMTAPASTASITADGFESHEAMRLGFNPYRNRSWEKVANEEEAMRWQEDTLPIACIDFCKRQVDDFVSHFTKPDGAKPRYVAQKMMLSPMRYLVHAIYAQPREIFLVRDFRDVWLSARSFNRKRGVASFERNRFSDDLAWMRGLAFTSHQMRLAHEAAGSRAQIVHYEELVRGPQEALTRVFTVLGLDSSASQLHREIVRNMAQSTESMAHRTAVPDGTVARWRQEMTQEEKDIAADAFGDDLRYFGYEA
jgi:hypothetical protein